MDMQQAPQGFQGQQGAQGQAPQGMALPRFKIQEFENKLGSMPDSSLKQLAQDPKYMTNAMYGPLINAELTRRVSARQTAQTPQAPQGQQPTVVQQAQQAAQQLPEDTGIGQLPAENIQNMAGGGIVALADGGDPADGEGVYIPDEELGISQYAGDDIQVGGDAEDPLAAQTESDRAAVRDALRRAKAAGMDVLSAPGRLAARAAETFVGRPLRAAGLDVPRLSGSGSLTPYYDKISQEDAAKNANDPLGQAGDIPTRAPSSATPSAAASRGPGAPAAASSGIAAAAQRMGVDATGAAQPTAAPTFSFTGARPDEEQALRDLQAQRMELLKAAQKDQDEYVARRGAFGKGQEERIAKQEAGLEKRKEQAQGMALLQAGLAIMAAPPGRGAMAAIGAGAQTGLRMYQGELDKLEAASSRIQSARDRLEEIRYREATADEATKRQLKSEERAAIMDGAKGMQEIAKRYNYDLPLASATANFQSAVKAWEVTTREAGDTSRAELNARTLLERERMGNLTQLQAASLRGAGGAGSANRLDEKILTAARELAMKENPKWLTMDDETKMKVLMGYYANIQQMMGRGSGSSGVVAPTQGWGQSRQIGP
jgi:hypothetical protein